MRWTVLLLILATPAMAQEAEQDGPPIGFFTGVYEQVGRDAETPPNLINDLVEIQPTQEGWGLLVSSCHTPQAGGWPLELRRSLFDEVPNMLEGKDGVFSLWCQHFTDHSNYPVLTCASENGARYTLWPVTDERAEACQR